MIEKFSLGRVLLLQICQEHGIDVLQHFVRGFLPLFSLPAKFGLIDHLVNAQAHVHTIPLQDFEMMLSAWFICLYEPFSMIIIVRNHI